MKKTTKHTDVSAPQTVTSFIKVHNGKETIQIGFTDKRISAHAGLSAFGGFLHWHNFGSVLKSWLPGRTSPNAMPAEDLGMGFLTGVLSGAKKLSQVAHLRQDPLLPELLGIERIGSHQLTRAFSRVSEVRRLIVNALGDYGAGAWIGYGAERTATLWMWTARNCCMRTVTKKKALRPVILPGAANGLITHCWR